MTVRNGSAEWHGNVESGSGTVTVGDGVFEGPYSYDSRFGEGKGTNPEQLIAAAHAFPQPSRTAVEDHRVGESRGLLRHSRLFMVVRIVPALGN
jgi:hypothetical protein